jgi:hypothetical protein
MIDLEVSEDRAHPTVGAHRPMTVDPSRIQDHTDHPNRNREAVEEDMGGNHRKVPEQPYSSDPFPYAPAADDGAQLLGSKAPLERARQSDRLATNDFLSVPLARDG